MLSTQSLKYTETHPYAGVVLSVFDNGGATHFSNPLNTAFIHSYLHATTFCHILLIHRLACLYTSDKSFDHHY